MLFDDTKEVFCVLLSFIFDAEVVDHQREFDGTPFVVPKPWDVSVLVVAMFVESFFKEFLRNEP